MSDYIAPFRLCGNIYFVGTEKASSHLIDTGDGLILIDTGYNTTAEVIVNSMKELGFDIKDVKIILHSHGHLDHTGGTPEILKLCSAKTYLGKEDLRYLKGSFEPDEYYEDGQVIELGDTSIYCMATPGHTLGTYSFFWNITEDGKTLRAAMFGGAGTRQVSKPFLNRLGGLFYFQRGDFFRSIEKLKAEHVDVFVGNHTWNNNTVEKAEILRATGENKFIDDTCWLAFLEKVESDLRALIAKESRELFVNYAHRGASTYCPENTLLSFSKGKYMRANGIETDIHKTKDGVLVLFHDDTLERVTGEEGTIGDYTFEELQAFNVENGDLTDKIVSFEDFLIHFSHRDITFAIELKDSFVEKETVELLRKYNMVSKTVITSFNFDNLKRAIEIAPEFKYGYLVLKEVTDEILADMKKYGIDELCPRATYMTEELVTKWHEDGFRVRAWGVANEELMRKVYDIGADGMTVNFPDKLTEYIASKKAE